MAYALKHRTTKGLEKGRPFPLGATVLPGGVNFAIYSQHALKRAVIRAQREEAPHTPLTPRQLEILKRCKDGKTRSQIGEILSISPKTVEFHLRGIMDKLGASNQISAVVIALQRGLIEL